MPPYHPGKVLRILRKDSDVPAADDSVQVMLETWDGLVWTVSLDPRLPFQELKEGEIVLADWSPDPVSKAPRMTIIKILKGKKGKDVWGTYQKYCEKMKAKQPAQTATQQQYIG